MSRHHFNDLHRSIFSIFFTISTTERSNLWTGTMELNSSLTFCQWCRRRRKKNSLRRFTIYPRIVATQSVSDAIIYVRSIWWNIPLSIRFSTHVLTTTHRTAFLQRFYDNPGVATLPYTHCAMYSTYNFEYVCTKKNYPPVWVTHWQEYQLNFITHLYVGDTKLWLWNLHNSFPSWVFFSSGFARERFYTH